MTSVGRRILVALILLSLGQAMSSAAFESSARANVAVEARFWDEQARAAFARRRFDDAMEFFLLEQEISPSARTLYNIGVCAQSAGHVADAYGYFEDYRIAGDDDAARMHDAQSRQTTRGRRLALLRVVSTPPGAAIYVDRRELGSHGVTPRTIVVSAGEHRVQVALADHLAGSDHVTAIRSETVESRFALAPERGSARITVAPQDATWSIHRRATGDMVQTGTGSATLSIPAGAYELETRHPQYTGARQPLVVTARGTSLADVRLTPRPGQSGRLLVSIHPEARFQAGEVHIDGVRRGALPMAVDLAPGPHTVEVFPASRRSRFGRRITVAPFTEHVLVSRDSPSHIRVGAP